MNHDMYQPKPWLTMIYHDLPWYEPLSINHCFNGTFRILKWRYVNVPYVWPYELWGIFPEI
jgi:hypothetical protein